MVVPQPARLPTGPSPTTPPAPVTGGGAEEFRRTYDPCDAATVAGLALEDVEQVHYVIVAGRDVTAVVARPDESGGQRLVVVDDESCEIVDDRLLR